jgi:hypothetical protein
LADAEILEEIAGTGLRHRPHHHHCSGAIELAQPSRRY